MNTNVSESNSSLKHSIICQSNIISEEEIQSNITKLEHIGQGSELNCSRKFQINQTNNGFFYDNLGYG